MIKSSEAALEKEGLNIYHPDSGFVGIAFNGQTKWQLRFSLDSKRLFIGSFHAPIRLPR